MALWVELSVLYTVVDPNAGSRFREACSPEKSEKMRTLDFDSKKPELEQRVGHPIFIPDIKNFGYQWHGDDAKIFEEGECNKPLRPALPFCKYDGSNSHWASRSERELTDICKRRGMPGGGYSNKAGLLKWLDTGELDYAGLYMGGLERICR
jgi:hypothetical protein